MINVNKNGFLAPLIFIIVFFSILVFPVLADTPVIIAVSPTKAAPGDTITVYGSALSGTVDLKSVQGLTYSTNGFFSDSGDEYKFEVSDSLPTGTYTIKINSPTKTIESSQSFSISNGGKPFGTVVKAKIPTEGLLGFGQLVAMIFTWSLNILGIVVFVMIFYAGFKWFTAAGNTARVNEARSQITNAITGAIILLAAYIILYTINPDLVGGKEGGVLLPGIGTETSN